jgi:hypothetical protein
MDTDRLVVTQRRRPTLVGAAWTALLTGVVLAVVVTVGTYFWMRDGNPLMLVALCLLTFGFLALYGQTAVASFRLALRPQRLLVDREGMTLESQDRVWRFPWTDVTWVGVGIGAGSANQSLFAALGPGAPAVRRRVPIPPVYLPKTQAVWLFDLMTADRDPVEVAAAVQRLAGDRWRADPDGAG